MATPRYEGLYASCLKGMGNSAIREILKCTAIPGFISLGGGLPDPDSFPKQTINDLYQQVERKYGPNIYQYGKTEGFDPLLAVLPTFLARDNRQVVATPDNIVITAGSQEALNILGMMLIDKGTEVAVEAPTYLGALQAFNAYGPRYVEVPTDKDGINPVAFEKVLQQNPNIKFLYTIPTFQNPSGSMMTRDRRQAIAKLLQKYGKLAVEDDPYSELRYEGDAIPSIQSMAPDNVIHLFTFSKTLAPGFRIGGMVAPTDIKNTANTIKQGTSLFTPNHPQAVVAEYLLGGCLDKHIPDIVALYRPRRDCMYEAIEKYFPDEFQANCPEGGMFLWASLRDGVSTPASFDIKTVFEAVVKQNVGFVPGTPFFAKPVGRAPSMRLNFTNQKEENIEKGIKVIGDTLKRQLR